MRDTSTDRGELLTLRHTRRTDRSPGRLREWAKKAGAGALALALAGTLGWVQQEAAHAETVYEIVGNWQPGTPSTLKMGDNAVSVWRFNINDDGPAPSNDPVDNVTVTFQVQHGVFTVLPEPCLVEDVTPLSEISADGASLTCNLGTRDQGTAELMLTGIQAVGNTGDLVFVSAEIGGEQAQLPEIPIENVFAMDMKFDGGTGASNEGTQQKGVFPWSLRHAPGGEPGPDTVSYDLTFSASGSETLLPHAEGCDVLGFNSAGHPRSDGQGAADRQAPFVASCTLISIGANQMRLTLTGIDYSKAVLPTRDSSGVPLPTDWDVVASGEINIRFAWNGGTTVGMTASAPVYTSVNGATSTDLAANNSNSRAFTRGIYTGGWRFGALHPQLPGTQWTDTSRAMAGDTILATAGVLPPAPGEPSAGLCVVMDNRYVDFVDASVGTISQGEVTPYPGITYWYYTGNGQSNNLNPNHANYNPNTFTCDGTGWTTTKPTDPSSIRAVRAVITAAAAANIQESLATLYVFSRIKDDVAVGQDIWTWMSYNRNGGTSWQNPTRSTNPSDIPAVGTATPGTRYPFTAGGRDIMRVIAANPRVTKVADQDYSVPGATVQYTVNYRAEAGSSVSLPSYTLTDVLPPGTTYVAGSASTAPTNVNGQTLTWNLTNVQTNTDYVLTYGVRLPDDAEPGDAFTNNVTAEISGSTARASDTVQIRDGGAVLLTKTAAASKVPHNAGAAEDSWTVRLTSTDTRSSSFTDTVDVLPYNGDGRGTAFSGGYLLSGPVQAVVGATVYYTTADPATIADDPAHSSNGAAGDVTGNTVGWSTVFTPDATAVRVIGPALPAGQQQEFVIGVVTEGASHGDRYVNRAEARSARHELKMRTSSAFEIGAVNSVTIKKYVQDDEGDWHDANDIDDYPAYHSGDTVPYRLVVTNTGDETLQGLEISDDRVDLASLDPLPAGLTLVDGKAVIAELLPGEDNQVVIEYQVPVVAGTPAGSLVNTACVIPEPVDPDDEDGPSIPAEEDCDPAGITVLPSSLSWEKIAAGTPDIERLSGSEWELTPVDESGDPTGAPVAVIDCVEDAAEDCDGPDVHPGAGQFTIDPLEDGRYRLVETRAPAGYQLDPSPRFIQVLGATSFDAPIANEQHEGPSLPLTGGVGTLGFWLGTGVLGGLVAAGLLWQRRRRTAMMAG